MARAGMDGSTPFQVNPRNRKNIPTSLDKVKSGNQTQHQVPYQAANWTSENWNLGVQTANGRTTGIVWTLCKPL